ncbi:hypothetical protein GIB67_017104 [Kingdonia uniflora]|uniref:BUB1 N-terminal domain-containing protein n=1 Tax=Kingdonia uniflora TaxID=39325 RepID=A0A7J7NCC7_9MAGN|nr:hypothetical protein GIB67_017104 [Kingdonia uniflora]
MQFRGIKKMRESLPPQFLKEKLPRFLQKCARTFEADRCYRNDLRYIRVWIQLMDFVDDPRALLKVMETNRIGLKRALFYEAYALYYEKVKKFEEAERMYHLGVRNLAEPSQELQKAYEQFLRRMDQYKKRKTRRQEVRAFMTCRHNVEIEETKEESCSAKGGCTGTEALSKPCRSKEVRGYVGPGGALKKQEAISIESKRPSRVCNDETVVVKFVDTAIVGKSEAEDACHHGLVDPTINLKEAMNDINNMFREPLELGAVIRRKSQETISKQDEGVTSGFKVFVDESLDNETDFSYQNKENVDAALSNKHIAETQMPLQQSFEIYVDDEDDNGNDILDKIEGSAPRLNAFLFPRPNDGSADTHMKSSTNFIHREDTIVGRFVGSAIADEPEVENACHHGLVEPTINLKEAMETINGMFGKPLDFVKTNRSKKQGKFVEKKRDCGAFSILPDDDLKSQQQPHASLCSLSKLESGKFVEKKRNCGVFSILPDDDLKSQQQLHASLCSSSKLGSGECELFEPTMFTKQAMDDINEMFGKSLDF